MSLVVHIKNAWKLRGRGGRQVKIIFRGNHQYTEIVKSHDKEATWDQQFEWPVGSELHQDEIIDIVLLNHGKLRTNVYVGHLQIITQDLVKYGELYITERLLDSHRNTQLETVISLDILYFSPDGKVGCHWTHERFAPIVEEEEDWWDDDDGLSRRSSISSIGLGMGLKQIRKLGKKKKRKHYDDDDGDVDGDEKPRMSALYKKKPALEDATLVPHNWQVNVTIIEARQLAGVDISPAICVTVGDDIKHTAVKKSTSCPYFDELMVFDYHCAQATLFDKVVKIQAVVGHSRFKAGHVIGQFKFDIGTLHLAQDHMYYHKWAVLIDPKDINGGIKGYVKMNISYFGKGEILKTPVAIDDDNNFDKEENLLLPEGMKPERSMGEFIVRVFRAEDLPVMNSVMLANVKKVFTRSIKDLVDPFVVVAFGGQSGKTTVKNNRYNPFWNEQIVFKENFPPLSRRIKIELRDRNGVIDELIGSHFIDMTRISNNGHNGFLPTFGPSWINLYGSMRGYSALRDHSHLNQGLGEGCMYRGRILIAVETKIADSSLHSGSISVEESPTLPISETAPGVKEDFFLFGCFLNANMIDKKIGDKPISFELSIGTHGNYLDGQGAELKTMEELFKLSEVKVEPEDEEDEGSKTKPSKIESMTYPIQPKTKDKYYYYMPYEEKKPCAYVKFKWESLVTRLYDQNTYYRIAENLEEGLAKVSDRVMKENPHPEKLLIKVMDQLSKGCNDIVRLTSDSGKHYPGKTNLDKERHKRILRETGKIAKDVRPYKKKSSNGHSLVTAANFKAKLKECYTILKKIQHLAKEPQDNLPDVFIWMISGEKRIAYYRIPARRLMYSQDDEEKGRLCGRVQTFFLRLPGKKSTGKSGWNTQCKLQVYLWLGLAKYKREFLQGLPLGYEITPEMNRMSKPKTIPPNIITYREKHKYQLRAHLYQARAMIGSDDSGLSDPFARVIFGNQYLYTQVVNETLSPKWDQTFVFDNVVMYGEADAVKQYPPMIVVEVYDEDNIGKAEFLGRALANPVIKMKNQAYREPHFPPLLEWFHIFRGSSRAGELLAAFELFELEDQHNFQKLPPLPEDGSLPDYIKPEVCPYRIEILFWGVRMMKRLQLMPVDSPKVDIEIGGNTVHSSMILNTSKNPNFSNPLTYIDLELPANEDYCPPVNIRVMDCRRFGRVALVGTHTIHTMRRFRYNPKKPKTNPKAVDGATGTSMNKMTLPATSKDQGVSKKIEQEKNKQEPNADVKEVIENTINEDKKDTVSISSKSSILKVGLKMLKSPLNGSDIIHLPLNEEPMKDTQSPESKTDNEQKSGDVIITVTPDDGQNSKKDTLNIDIPGTSESTEPPPPVEAPEAKGGGSKKIEDIDESELDWWSKYYETKKDMAKAEQRKMMRKMALKKKQKKKSNKGEDEEETDDHVPGDDDDSSSDSDSKVKIEDDDDADKADTERQCALGSLPKLNICKIKIYPCGLEGVPEFNGFKEWLNTFELYRGKNGDGEEEEDSRLVGAFKLLWPSTSRLVGYFKGSLSVYKYPITEDGTNPFGFNPREGSYFKGLPKNDPTNVLIRVYVVKALNLHPADLNGKADPYIAVQLGKQKMSDKENYVSKNLNPVFGKSFEFEALFPQESMLIVQVYDWDMIGRNDLIGETKIDLENRFYSRHRALCGIAQQYATHGYNRWRDSLKPTQILAKLCKTAKMDEPVYSPGSVTVGNKMFTGKKQIPDDDGRLMNSYEPVALEALKHWDEMPRGRKLVPEHVETRSLFNPSVPGIEQGKLEMWVEMFPMDLPRPLAPVSITPRKPERYELRVIIWNTEDVVLEDSSALTGEAMSDIYVKGWLIGAQDDKQETDVHYSSMTGEGYFNWRFVFPFEYLNLEEKVVYWKKESEYALDKTEYKLPPRLNLQVWDADAFSANDILGSMVLDLNRFPRGAKDSKKCTLKMLKRDGSVPMVSLFKLKKTRGWWPFTRKREYDDKPKLTGKVEAELTLLLGEEADKNPAGLARKEPDPLDKPNRPNASFIFIMGPLKALRFLICVRLKRICLKLMVLTLLLALVGLFFYSMPGYTVKKIFGA
ncbi:otoferlin-like isoform X2 [Glandiceps talaboti]